jgi:hypothetical protein
MMLNAGIVLGHHISYVGIGVDLEKIEVIVNMEVPSSQREVRSFLGHVGYYRYFIENFTKNVSPLFKLLAKEVEFYWNNTFQIAFETLK